MAKLEVKLHLADRNVLTLTCTDYGVLGMIRMLRQSRIVRTEVNAVSPPEPVPDKVESFTIGERREKARRARGNRRITYPDVYLINRRRVVRRGEDMVRFSCSRGDRRVAK